MADVDKCVFCAEPIPEGIQVCSSCGGRSEFVPAGPEGRDFYKEIFRLAGMLSTAKIPFSFTSNFDGWQIGYPSLARDRRICSTIEHHVSYGAEQDLLEIRGLLTPDEMKDDDVLGYLKAEEVFARIKKHWESTGHG